jgi:hypothetical protein
MDDPRTLGIQVSSVDIKGEVRTPYEMKESKHRFATTAFFLSPSQLMGSSGSPSLNLSMVGTMGCTSDSLRVGEEKYWKCLWSLVNG